MVDVKFHCDEQSNFKNSLSVRAFTYTNYSIERHYHHFYEINIILSGKGTHCIENNSFDVVPGDVFVIPPMIVHSYIDTDNLEVYHILLKKGFVEQNKNESENVQGFLQLTEIEPFLRSNSTKDFFLHLSPTELLQLRNELEYIDDRSIFSWEECSLMKHHCIWKILYWFSKLLDIQLHSEKKPQKKYALCIMKALKYIHTNYSEKISIDSLCSKIFMSRSTFLRTFKEICNISPIEYLNNYRCKKAEELLECGEHSKTTVAHSCGFYDLSHMERMLKNYPSNSRKV